jgi:hypothetical protein
MAGKKRILHDLDCGPWDPAGTPWGQEATSYCQESREPFDECRDIVILDYLQNGDTRPLVDLLRTGKAPGPAVLRFMAAMFGEPTHKLHESLSFELLIKGKNGNRVRQRDYVWRDKLLSDSVEKIMNGDRGVYESAIMTVAKKYDLSVDTVRNAYDERR